MNDFDGHDYTETAVLEELSLIERHARDGSAVTAGCACIEEKHLLTLSGLCSEMPTLTSDKAEAEFYGWLAEHARELRKRIIEGDFGGKTKASAKQEEKVAACMAKGASESECRATV
jgi:hypothetical protein